VFASADPVTTHAVAEGVPTRATVVPVAAAVALPGKIKHAPGAVIVVENEIVQVVVAEAPIVMLPDWLVPEMLPFVPVPHAPEAIVGVPKVETICPENVFRPLFVLLPLSRGTVAPEVPVLAVQAVPAVERSVH
jgi:hypothetical protein